jgi:hypothetical protein
MVISVDLNTAVRKGYDNRKNIIEGFGNDADYQGVVRFLTGLGMNYIVSKHNVLPCKLDKTFLDRIWSAIEKWAFEPDKAKTSKEFTMREIGSFLTDCNFNNLKQILKNKRPFDLRQRTTDDMRVSCVSHIANNFECRIVSYAKYLVSNIERIVQEFPLVKERSHIVKQLVSSILKPGEVAVPDSIQNYDHVIDFVERGRECVQSLLNEEGGEKPLSYVLKSAPHLAVPFLAWLSSQASAINCRIRQIVEESNELSLSGSQRKKYISNQIKDKKCRMPPKSFSLLPYFKLQRCFVDYCTTEVQTLMSSDKTMDYILNEVFDLTQIPQVKNKSMRLLGFRTDGFTLEVKLVSLATTRPYSPNTNHLSESGYQLPLPKKGVDVLTEKRGIYRITEKRYDNYPIDQIDVNKVALCVVDPGVKKPVCVRYVDLNSANDASDIMANSKVWNLDCDKYRVMSQYDVVKRRHSLRCIKNKKYRYALKDMSKQCKKTAIHNDIVSYCATIAKYLDVLVKEHMHRQRSKARRVHQKYRQSAIAIIADKIVSCTKSGKDTSNLDCRKRTVVIWGDGNFKTPKGCVSVPRKILAHAVACRALTFATSEHRSSCGCPGCEHGVIEDICKGSRVRRCNSNSLTPNNPCVFSSLQVDRDELATISLARIAYDALINQSRPVQYRNQQSPVSLDAVKRSTRKRGTLSKGLGGNVQPDNSV